MRVKILFVLTLVCLFGVQLVSARDILLYDVDFSSPPHILNQTVVTGYGSIPRKTPTEVVFGRPKVISSLGSLTDQPLSMSGYGMGGEFDYTQMRFSLEGSEIELFPVYTIEMDVLINESTGSLTILLDTPQVRTLSFYEDGDIRVYIPGYGGYLGKYTKGKQLHVKMVVDLNSAKWTIYIDNLSPKTFNFRTNTLEKMRISLANSTNSSVAIDNIKIYAEDAGALLSDIDIIGPEYINGDKQFQAIAVFDDGLKQDVTSKCTWGLSSDKFATINESGMLSIHDRYTAFDVTLTAQYTDDAITVRTQKSLHYEPLVTDYYVDGKNGSDQNNGLAENCAFATIQYAIDSAIPGSRIYVKPGVYTENISYNGKAVMVQGFGGVPVIDGGGYWAVSFFYGEDKNSVLRNFMLTNSYMGIFVAGSSPKISNVNIVGNMFGIEAYSGANPDVVNCILWNNTDGDIFGCQPRFSCIEREEQAGGEGNITASPLFADSGAGDYRLRSQLGRYMPQLDLWVVDEITSPCVNAGDPSVNPGNEPMPNGGRINIGAYGDTSQASRGQWVLTGDLNKDGVVDMSDLAILEENWLLRLGWVETQ